MHRTTSRLSIFVSAILAACSSAGEIGSEHCVDAASGCDVPLAINYIAPPSFADVSTEAVGEAHITDMMPLSCAGSVSCLGQLVADDEGGVWTLLRDMSEERVSTLRFTHHDARGTLLAESEVGDEEGLALERMSRPFRLPEGGIAMGTTWRTGSRERPDAYRLEVLRVDDGGSDRLPIAHSKPLPTSGTSGSFMATTSFEVAPQQGGFVASFSAPDERVVRRLDDSGMELWQRAVPHDATERFSVIALPSGFALQTRGKVPDASSSLEITGFLWYDQDGQVIRHVFLPNLGAEFTLGLGLSDGRLALASVIAFPEESQDRFTRINDLYVVRVANDGELSGHRLRSESAVVPSAHALVRDANDTIYVSTVAGKRSAPHGLICVLPEHGEAACHSLPAGTVFGSLAAVGNGVVYGLTEEALVRLELASGP